MRALEFLIGHVIVKLHYDQIYQMKTTNYSKIIIILHKVSYPIVKYSSALYARPISSVSFNAIKPDLVFLYTAA